MGRRHRSLFSLSFYDPMNRDIDPEEKEAATAVKRALLELQFYASSDTIHPAMSENVQALVSAGALTRETSGFIFTHCARFHGFNPAVTEQQIPVLEVV